MVNLHELDSMLPFVLKRANVARYEDGQVLIGDRIAYPFSKEFVRCDDVESVARAIETMVTQGGGPWIAAAFAMAMAAKKVENKSPQDQLEFLEKAKNRLVETRPTNTAMARRLSETIQVVQKAQDEGRSIELELLGWIRVCETRPMRVMR